jgi:hypothetical protein
MHLSAKHRAINMGRGSGERPPRSLISVTAKNETRNFRCRAAPAAASSPVGLLNDELRLFHDVDQATAAFRNTRSTVCGASSITISSTRAACSG